MAVLRELFSAEPILTSVAGVVTLIVGLMIRDIVVGLRRKPEHIPENSNW